LSRHRYIISSVPELVTPNVRPGWWAPSRRSNARPTSLLNDWLDQIADENAAYASQHPDVIRRPFAVNQIVHRSNDRLDHDMAVIVEHRVPIVITSLGARPEINEAVHSTAASCCTT